jgi:hypothetical protein
MQVFACSRPKPPRCQAPCRQPARRCEFPLTGVKTGEICPREICDTHSKIVDGKRVCLPHVKIMKPELKAS